MSKKITNPHDKFFRLSMQDPDIAKDFFKHHLNKELLKEIDLNSLKLQPESYIKEELQEQISDILYRVKTKKREDRYLYLLAEHQSSPDRLMAFRILKYNCEIIQRHIDKGHKYLPQIHNLLFYHGRCKYPYSNNLFNLYKDPQKASQTQLKSFQLIDTNQMTDEEIERHGFASPMEFIQKHIFIRDMLIPLEKLLNSAKIIKKIKSKRDRGYIFTITKYIITAGEINDNKKAFKLICDKFNEEERNIMTIAEHLRQEGKLEGINLGRQEGRQEGLYQTAKRLLSETDFDDEKISKLTGLSLEEIKEIQDKDK